MLKISKLDRITNSTTLRLEGTLSGAWVEELRRLCEIALADGERITLDCAGISFSDSDGVALMQELRGRNVSLTNCSPFLRFQLEPGSTI